VDPAEERAPAPAREQPVGERRQRAAEVKRPGGAGSEADADGHGIRQSGAVGCRSRTRWASTRRIFDSTPGFWPSIEANPDVVSTISRTGPSAVAVAVRLP